MTIPRGMHLLVGAGFAHCGAHHTGQWLGCDRALLSRANRGCAGCGDRKPPGRQRHHRGHVQFEGESFDSIPAHEPAARGLVMVPEGGRLFPIMAERRGQLAGRLSGGERQMCALARAQCAADVLCLRLQGLPTQACQIDLVGVDSVLRGSARAAAAPPAELRVHISAACDDAATAQWVEDEVYALTLSGLAGGCSVRSEKRPRLAVVDGLIDRRLVTTELVWGQP